MAGGGNFAEAEQYSTTFLQIPMNSSGVKLPYIIAVAFCRRRVPFVYQLPLERLARVGIARSARANRLVHQVFIERDIGCQRKGPFPPPVPEKQVPRFCPQQALVYKRSFLS